MNSEYQLRIMKADFDVYGKRQSGLYRGIYFLARKYHKNGWWCACFQPHRELTAENYVSLQRAAHGVLMVEGDRIGFGCCERNDFPAFDDGQYRDFPYVLRTLKNMIDVLLDE